MSRAWFGRVLVIALVVLAVSCGDDDDGSGQEDTTGTTAESTASAEDAQADGGDADECLEDAGLEVAEEGATDMPIVGGGGGPPILQEVEGVGVRGGTGAAVYFRYDTPAEAEQAASTLGVEAQGNVVIVPDDQFPPEAEAAIVACVGGDGGSG